MNPEKAKNPEGNKTSEAGIFRALRAAGRKFLKGLGLNSEPKKSAFATITLNGEELDITNPLPPQINPEGRIEIPEIDPILEIPQESADGPVVNIEELPPLKPQRRRGDGGDGSFDKKLAGMD